jgi:hypothetical protein
MTSFRKAEDFVPARRFEGAVGEEGVLGLHPQEPVPEEGSVVGVIVDGIHPQECFRRKWDMLPIYTYIKSLLFDNV